MPASTVTFRALLQQQDEPVLEWTERGAAGSKMCLVAFVWSEGVPLVVFDVYNNIRTLTDSRDPNTKEKKFLPAA